MPMGRNFKLNFAMLHLRRAASACKSRKYLVYDVFTDTDLPAIRWPWCSTATGSTTRRCRRSRGEFNLSETVFILPPRSKAHRASVRIFTPMHELPFAGHPTVGAAIAIAEAAGDGDGRRSSCWRKRSGRCAAPSRKGRTACSPNSTCRGCLSRWHSPAIRRRSAASLGLDRARDRLREPLASAYSGGVPYITGAGRRARCRGQGRSRHARLDGADRAGRGAVARRLRLLPRDDGRTATPSTRACSPAHLGTYEDPATGSAVASFAGAIMRFDKPVDGVSRHPIEQGVEMGRPSLIRLELDVGKAALAGARIGGNAVKVSEGMLFA